MVHFENKNAFISVVNKVDKSKTSEEDMRTLAQWALFYEYVEIFLDDDFSEYLWNIGVRDKFDITIALEYRAFNGKDDQEKIMRILDSWICYTTSGICLSAYYKFSNEESPLYNKRVAQAFLKSRLSDTVKPSKVPQEWRYLNGMKIDREIRKEFNLPGYLPGFEFNDTPFADE